MIPSFVGRVSRRRNPPDVNPCGAMRFAYCALRGLDELRGILEELGEEVVE